MRIVARLGVLDEVELIGAAIAHLKAIGVDLVIACDRGSTDGTQDVLERHAAQGDVWHHVMSNRSDPDDWAAQTLRLIRSADADWVIFLDADEFPLPSSGSLRDCASLHDADVLEVDRFNVASGGDAPVSAATFGRDRYATLALIAEPIDDFWAHLERHPDTPWVMQRPYRKLMVRPAVIEKIELGGHEVAVRPGRSVRRVTPPDLIAAHVPFTTRSRFLRKVANLRVLLDEHGATLPPTAARHWRRWATQDPAALDAEFERMGLGAAELAELRARGIVRPASEILAQRGAPGWATAHPAERTLMLIEAPVTLELTPGRWQEHTIPRTHGVPAPFSVAVAGDAGPAVNAQIIFYARSPEDYFWTTARLGADAPAQVIASASMHAVGRPSWDAVDRVVVRGKSAEPDRLRIRELRLLLA